LLFRSALVPFALAWLVAPGVQGASGATHATPLGIKGRVLKSGEFAGFTAKAPAVVVINLDDWVKIAPSGGINVRDRLRRAGFVAASREDLVWTKGTDRGGLSAVVRLRSAQAARNEIAQQIRDFANEPSRGRAKSYTTFPVPGVPGAHGFTLTTQQTSGHNIIFADGPFTYHLGVGWGNQAGNPPTLAQLITAAKALYARVHARPAPPI
jgi:hypothetical protein